MSLPAAIVASAGEPREEICVAKSVAELTSQNTVVRVQKVQAGVVKIPGPLLRFYDVTLSVERGEKISRHEFRCRDDGGEVAIVQRQPYPKPVASVFLWRQAPEAARRRRFGVEASRLALSRGPIAALGEGGESRVASGEPSQGSARLRRLFSRSSDWERCSQQTVFPQLNEEARICAGRFFGSLLPVWQL